MRVMTILIGMHDWDQTTGGWLLCYQLVQVDWHWMICTGCIWVYFVGGEMIVFVVVVIFVWTSAFCNKLCNDSDSFTVKVSEWSICAMIGYIMIMHWKWSRCFLVWEGSSNKLMHIKYYWHSRGRPGPLGWDLLCDLRKTVEKYGSVR